MTIGATVGGVIVGLLAGALGIFTLNRCRGSRNDYQHREDLMRDSQSSTSHPQSPREVTTAGGRARSVGGSGLEYIVEPFDDRPALTVMRFAVRDRTGEPVAVCGVAGPVSDPAGSSPRFGLLRRRERGRRRVHCSG